jgi:hypothetical protein
VALAASLHCPFQTMTASAIDRASGGAWSTAVTAAGSASSAWVTESSVVQPLALAALALESGCGDTAS